MIDRPSLRLKGALEEPIHVWRDEETEEKRRNVVSYVSWPRGKKENKPEETQESELREKGFNGPWKRNTQYTSI